MKARLEKSISSTKTPKTPKAHPHLSPILHICPKVHKAPKSICSSRRTRVYLRDQLQIRGKYYSVHSHTSPATKLVARTSAVQCKFYRGMYSVHDQGIARTQSPTNKNYAPELPTFGAIDGVSPTEVQWKGLVHGEPPYGSRYPLCQVSMLWQRSAPHRVGLLPVKRREGQRPRSAGHLSREPGRLPARCSARSAS